MPDNTIKIEDLIGEKYDYNPTAWHDKVVDPEGHNSHPGVKFTARRANNLEFGVDLAHARLDNIVGYQEGSERTIKNMRFEFLLLKASVASGLTDNMYVENFETINSIHLIGGLHDPELQRVYLP